MPCDGRFHCSAARWNCKRPKTCFYRTLMLEGNWTFDSNETEMQNNKTGTKIISFLGEVNDFLSFSLSPVTPNSMFVNDVVQR